jgi:hypothetical protein
MIGQPGVSFFIQLKYFLLGPVLDATDIITMMAVPDVRAMDSEKFLFVLNVLGINKVEITLAKRKVMDSVKKIGFT